MYCIDLSLFLSFYVWSQLFQTVISLFLSIYGEIKESRPRRLPSIPVPGADIHRHREGEEEHRGHFPEAAELARHVGRPQEVDRCHGHAQPWLTSLQKSCSLFLGVVDDNPTTFPKK